MCFKITVHKAVPDPVTDHVSSRKLSRVVPGLYLNGRLLGNTRGVSEWLVVARGGFGVDTSIAYVQ